MENTAAIMILTGIVLGLVGLFTTICVIAGIDERGKRKYTSTQKVFSALALIVGLVILFGGGVLMDLVH